MEDEERLAADRDDGREVDAEGCDASPGFVEPAAEDAGSPDDPDIAIAEGGRIGDDAAEAEAEAEAEEASDSKRVSRRKLAIAGAACAAVVAGALLFTFVVRPSMNISQGNEAFEAGDFDAAIGYFEAAGDFGGAPDLLAEARRASYREKGVDALEKEDYSRAIMHLERAKGYKDSDKLLASARAGRAYAEGVKLEGTGAIVQAAAKFIEAGGHKDAAERAAAIADRLSSEQKYDAALGIYEGLGKGYAEKAAATKVLVGYVEAMQSAEESASGGYFDSAVKEYGGVPDDFSYNGKNAGQRKALITKARDIAAACPDRNAAAPSKFKVTQTSRSTGYYYWWEGDGDNTGTDLIMDVKLADDGSIHVKGSVEFWRYTNFSTISQGLESDLVTKSFDVVVDSAPTYIQVDGETSLQFSDGVWKLSWEQFDNTRDLFFDYLFTANFTYK